MEALKDEFTLGKQKQEGQSPKQMGQSIQISLDLALLTHHQKRKKNYRRETETPPKKLKNPSIQKQGISTLTPKQIGTTKMRKQQKA